MLQRIPPKKTSAEFKPSAIRFLVPRGDGLYDYYPIRLGALKGLFLAIESTPPIIADGYVRYNRKLYAVTRRDILRKRINVSRSLNPTSLTVDDTPHVDVERATQANEQPGPCEGSEEELSKVADMVFQEQMRSLYGVENPEEEWQGLADSTQPGLSDEGSAV